MKKTLITAIYLAFSLILNAQLTGKITDAKGDILPFANVYLEGTTRGTTANTEGSIFLICPMERTVLSINQLAIKRK